MKTSSLDLLEKAQLPMAQAKAILTVMEDEFLTFRGDLATRTDLFVTKQELRQEMQEVRQDMQEVRQEMQEVRNEMYGLRGEMQGLRVEMHAMHAAIQKQFVDFQGVLTRWMITCMLSGAGLFAGAMYFMAGYLKR